MSLSPQDQYWGIKLEQLGKALSVNNFAVSIHGTAAQAAQHVIANLVSEQDVQTVGLGSSATVLASGLIESLRAQQGLSLYDVYAPGLAREDIVALRYKSMQADMYITSSNAVTMQGELVNLDGSGNRVSAMHFGPKKVVLLVGRNKVCATLDEARSRIKELAAPMNSMRLERNNPCTRTGHCHNCKSPERICSVWTITEKSFPAGRIHVCLINEDVGF